MVCFKNQNNLSSGSIDMHLFVKPVAPVDRTTHIRVGKPKPGLFSPPDHETQIAEKQIWKLKVKDSMSMRLLLLYIQVFNDSIFTLI